MSNGGRILHHERRYLSDPKSILLIISYQTAGSLGRKLLDGEKKVKIFDESIDVKCKIKTIGGYSAHPDKDGLMRWLTGFNTHKIKKIFVVQGEEGPSEALVNEIQDILCVNAIAPSKGDTFDL
jgi:metallo-beta-lactamase family protein